MTLVNNFQQLAKYNQRLNQQLLLACQAMSHETLTKDLGAFFPSVLDHWNHILFGDLILLRRLLASDCFDVGIELLAELPLATEPRQIFASNLAELKALRTRLDQDLVTFFKQLTDVQSQQTISYQTTEGDRVSQSVAVACQHLFNHQAHHRGQLTCLLSQLGIEYGCTDLPVIIAQ